MEQQNFLGCHVEMVAPGESLDSPDENHKKFVSAVEEISGDRLLLSMPMYRSMYAPMHKDERYDTYIFLKSKIYQCQVCVQGAVKEEKHISLVTKIISSIQKYERREFFRLPYSTEVYCKRLEPGLVDVYREYLKEGREILEEDFLKGVVIDLSAGGMKYMSGEKLYREDSIVLYFTVTYDNEKTATFLMLARVIESTKHPEQSGVFIHRIAFEIQNPKMREMLVSFIFQEQRKSLRKSE